MKKTYTCIICPNGCEIEADIREGKIAAMEGNLCKKGTEYVSQEILNPVRSIATSVYVENGALPLASVKLTKAIPKNKIFEAMKEIKKLRIQAPAEAGTVILKNICGYESDVTITKSVHAKEISG